MPWKAAPDLRRYSRQAVFQSPKRVSRMRNHKNPNPPSHRQTESEPLPPAATWIDAQNATVSGDNSPIRTMPPRETHGAPPHDRYESATPRPAGRSHQARRPPPQLPGRSAESEPPRESPENRFAPPPASVTAEPAALAQVVQLLRSPRAAAKTGAGSRTSFSRSNAVRILMR